MKKPLNNECKLLVPAFPLSPVIRQSPRYKGLTLLNGKYVNHHFSPHFHEEYAIGVIQAGVQKARIGRHANVIMPAGSVVIINPGDVHTGQPADENGWVYSMIYIPVEIIRDKCRHFGSLCHDPLFPNPAFFDTLLAERILALHKLLAESSPLLLKEDVLFAEAIDRLMPYSIKSAETCKSRQENLLIKKAIDYIDTNFAENIRLEDLSRLVDLSPFHFLRQFKQTIGVTPHVYLVHTRLRHARRRLLAGDPPAVIAIETGFSDQSHFTRLLRRFSGVTPGGFC